MSRGIGAKIELISQDNHKAIYKYGAFNWNIPECKNSEYDMDGQIIIMKDALPTIAFHNRNSKKANELKGKIKQVTEIMTFEEMLKNKYIVVTNSKYSWEKDAKFQVDLMAIKAVFRIFSQYTDNGEMPNRILIVT